MSDLYICMQPCKTRGRDLGACSPRKFLEIRCSEIASEAILGQKQSRNTWIVEYCIQFGCHVYAFVKPADIEFPREKVLRLAEKQIG